MEEGEAERVEAETAEVGESRTLQGIKSLFVTGTVMKILWLVEPRGREGRESGSTLPHRGGSLEYQSTG